MRRQALLLTFVLAATPVLADFNLPPRKPGQWEMKIQVDTAAMPPQIIRMCLDEESDKLLNDRFGGMAKSMCSKQDQHKDGDSLILDSDCKVGNMEAKSHTVVTGSFDSAYTMKTDINMSGSNAPKGLNGITPAGATTQATTIEAKRVGDCEAGFKPGDIDLGGGRVGNIRDMPKQEIQ